LPNAGALINGKKGMARGIYAVRFAAAGRLTLLLFILSPVFPPRLALLFVSKQEKKKEKNPL